MLRRESSAGAFRRSRENRFQQRHQLGRASSRLLAHQMSKPDAAQESGVQIFGTLHVTSQPEQIIGAPARQDRIARSAAPRVPPSVREGQHRKSPTALPSRPTCPYCRLLFASTRSLDSARRAHSRQAAGHHANEFRAQSGVRTRTPRVTTPLFSSIPVPSTAS